MSLVMSFSEVLQNLESFNCREHSSMYQLPSITTTAKPLSADYVIMSVCLRRRIGASGSFVVKLSGTGAGVTLKRSCFTGS